MSYDMLPARELLPYYPEHTQATYTAAGIGAGDWEDLSRDEKYGRLLNTVGNTPLHSFRFDDVRGTVHIKQELLSPTGSHCDRQALALYEMEKELMDVGYLVPGVTTIDETTSGSVGSSLAILGPLMGYQVHLRIPPLTENRLATMRMSGVKLEIVDGYIPEAAKAMIARLGALRRAGWKVEKIYTDRYKAFSATHPDGKETGHYFFPNHSADQTTIDAVSGLGTEFTQQLNEKGIALSGLVAIIGNGTSVHGAVPAFRTHQSQALVFGVEDARNHPTYDRFYGIHPLLRRYNRHDSYGSSAHGTPVTFPAESLLDGVDIVAPQVRDLARDAFNAQHPEVAFGNTSAMAYVVCKRVLATLNDDNAHVGMIAHDRISRY